MKRRHEIRNFLVTQDISVFFNLNFKIIFIGDNLVRSFPFADVHDAFVADVSGNGTADKQENKRKVKSQNRPFFPFPKSIASDISDKIDRKSTRLNSSHVKI